MLVLPHCHVAMLPGPGARSRRRLLVTTGTFWQTETVPRGGGKEWQCYYGLPSPRRQTVGPQSSEQTEWLRPGQLTFRLSAYRNKYTKQK